jgi:transcription antitermination factor NusG
MTENKNEGVQMNNNKIGDDALAKMAAITAKQGASRRAAEIASRSWHLVQIGQRNFELASRHLKAAGFELYSPMLRTMVTPRANQVAASQRKRRHLMLRERLTPFLGSYRFVNIDLSNDPWSEVFRTVGAYGLICTNGMPAPLPDDYVARLKAMEANGAINGQTPIENLLPYKPGDVAQVTDGPFVDFKGPVEKVDTDGRLSLVLDFFGCSRSIEFTFDQVQKIASH